MTMMMSGHCSFPATERLLDGKVVAVPPTYSHEKCLLPTCPCGCHLGTDEYKCANCDGALREAPRWPNEDEPDEMVYVHIDQTGRAIGEEC